MLAVSIAKFSLCINCDIFMIKNKAKKRPSQWAEYFNRSRQHRGVSTSLLESERIKPAYIPREADKCFQETQNNPLYKWVIVLALIIGLLLDQRSRVWGGQSPSGLGEITSSQLRFSLACFLRVLLFKQESRVVTVECVFSCSFSGLLRLLECLRVIAKCAKHRPAIWTVQLATDEAAPCLTVALLKAATPKRRVCQTAHYWQLKSFTDY